MDSMNKVIHAAVRRDLARLGGALDEVTDGDRRRATDLGRAWRNLRDQLRHHHEQEDTILFPVVVHLGDRPGAGRGARGRAPGDGRALDEIDTAMGSYATSASAADAADAADAVRRGTTVVDQHLAHEEGELEPLVRDHLETPEWKAAMRQLRKQPPRQAGWFFAWVEDGASDGGPSRSSRPRSRRRSGCILGRVFGRGYHRTIAPVWA